MLDSLHATTMSVALAREEPASCKQPDSIHLVMTMTTLMQDPYSLLSIAGRVYTLYRARQPLCNSRFGATMNTEYMQDTAIDIVKSYGAICDKCVMSLPAAQSQTACHQR